MNQPRTKLGELDRIARAAAISVFLLVSLSGADIAFADSPVYAVPKMKGRLRHGIAAFAKSFRAGLRNSGHTVLGPITLPNARPAIAYEEGATLMILGKSRRKNERYELTLEVIDLRSDRSIYTTREAYRKRKYASRVGFAAAKRLLRAIKSRVHPPEATEVAVTTDAPGTPDRTDSVDAEHVQSDARPVLPSLSTTETAVASESTSTVRDPAASAGAEAVVRLDASERDRPVFVIQAGGGARLRSSYTLTTGGNNTPLSYRLSPTALAEARMQFIVPSTGLSLDVAFAFTPVRYSISGAPITPVDPSGGVMTGRASILYALTLAEFGEVSSIVFEPIAGVSYERSSVSEQKIDASANALSPGERFALPAVGEPFPGILGYTALVAHAGARLKGRFGGMELIADARARLPLSYVEEGATTGDAPSGLGLFAGFEARYWITNGFGLGASIAYQTLDLQFSGQGTRPLVAANAPPLVDAELATTTLSSGLSLVIAI